MNKNKENLQSTSLFLKQCQQRNDEKCNNIAKWLSYPKKVREAK